MLKKIEKDSVQELVFQRLKSAILDGTFKSGSKLPSENELCAQLGVSRPSVKVAIQRLCMLSIVETRPGDGSYVTVFDPAAFFGQVTEFMVDDSNLSEVAEYRMHLDILYGTLAMERADEADLQEMDRLLEAMASSFAARDVERHSQLDYQLHTAIVHATKNSFIVKMYEMMQDLNLQYTYVENQNFFRELGITEFEDVHPSIVAAIRAKDRDQLVRIYRDKYTL